MLKGIFKNVERKKERSCNAWMYESPIRTCPKCKSEFLDKCWREVAIDGFDARSNNPKLYLIGFFGFLAITIICVICRILLINTLGHYPSQLLGCIIVGIVGSIGCLLILLIQITGIEDKNNAKFLEESERRLQDKDYVEKLIAYGYDVPDRYRKNICERYYK